MSLKHAHEYHHEHQFGKHKGPGGDMEHRQPRVYVEQDRLANLLGWQSGGGKKEEKPEESPNRHGHTYTHQHKPGKHPGPKQVAPDSAEVKSKAKLGTELPDPEGFGGGVYVERDRLANFLGWSGGKRKRSRRKRKKRRRRRTRRRTRRRRQRGGVSKKKRKKKRTSSRTNPKLGLRVGTDFARSPGRRMVDVESLCATLPPAPQPLMTMNNLAAALPTITPAPVVIVPPAGLRIINPASLRAIPPQIIRPIPRRAARGRCRAKRSKKYTWSKKGGRRRRRTRKKRHRR